MLSCLQFKSADMAALRSNRAGGRFTEPASGLERTAFTLIELLVVIGIICVLASLLLPVLAQGKERARFVKCINNQHQLFLACLSYTGDHMDHFPVNGALNSMPGLESGEKLWVQGGSHGYGPGFIDSSCFLNPNKASFAPYLKALGVYRCPADHYFTDFETPPPQRTMETLRSYSMNCYVGQVESIANDLSPAHVRFRKTSDLCRLPPAGAFLFMEVNPANLCLPAFIVRPEGFGIDGFYHYPATRHSRSAVMTWLDGHVDRHRWKDGRTFRYVPPPQIIAHWDPCPGNTDLDWLREHLTVSK